MSSGKAFLLILDMYCLLAGWHLLKNNARLNFVKYGRIAYSTEPIPSLMIYGLVGEMLLYGNIAKHVLNCEKGERKLSILLSIYVGPNNAATLRYSICCGMVVVVKQTTLSPAYTTTKNAIQAKI